VLFLEAFLVLLFEMIMTTKAPSVHNIANANINCWIAPTQCKFMACSSRFIPQRKIQNMKPITGKNQPEKTLFAAS